MSSSASIVIFQKTLQDLVKGIRSQKRDVSPYISKVIAEIKTELKSTDQFTKAEAVRKLTYLQMLGYDISFASFAIVEVMSSSRFAHKRIGFLAASQAFTDTTDVLLLTTNLFKKEFISMNHSLQSMYEIGLAVNCLANIVTKDLARDCIGDVVHLMTSPEAYIRKKAVLVLFKLFVQFPQGLRLTFDQLKERLEDENSSVVSCAVNVICELANRNPRNYIGMAPVFFRLLTTSSNNWMLIKVVKLFGSLVSEEPRLARKLLDPLMTIITSTSAKSLQFECINTVTLALPYTKREDGSDAKNAGAALKVCSSHIREFIKNEDQNLKYLGLVGLINLMKISPLVAVEHRDLVLHCLSDDDMTIKSRALELLAGMVTKKSLVDLVQHLLQHANNTEGPYREDIVAKVLLMCTKDKHGLVSDFAWYVSMLCSLSRLCNTFAGESKHIPLIADELIEITLRVESVRPFAVESMMSLLLDEEVVSSRQRIVLAQILASAAWIVGEYSSVLTSIYHDSSPENEHRYYIEGPFDKEIVSNWRGRFLHYILMRALLHPLVGGCLSSAVQSAYMIAAMKIFVEGVSTCDKSEVSSLVALLRVRFGDSSNLGTFAQSANLEVEERKSFFLQLFYDLRILIPSGIDNTPPEQTRDLIEFSHRDGKLADLDSSQVTDEDKLGAQNAIQNSAVLEALFAEPFYPVHAKAQRNVPIPPELNLKAAFNSRELDDFIGGGREHKKYNLASLSFVSASESKPFVAIGYGNEQYSGKVEIFDDAAKISKILGNVSSNDYVSTAATPLTAAVPSSLQSKSGKGPKDNQMFYLDGNSSKSSGSAAPMQFSDSHYSHGVPKSSTANLSTTSMPLSELLAIGHNSDRSPKNLSKKKQSKSRKSVKDATRSSKHVVIQAREVAPVGASSELMSSDDEKQKKPINKKAKNRDLGSDDENDLGNVDITAPLRADEVMPVHKHREYSSQQYSHEINENEEDRSKKKSKKSKKVKNRSNENHQNSHIESTYACSDLLGLGGSSSSAPQQPSCTSEQELLGPIGGLQCDQNSRDIRSSKKKDARLWRPLQISGVTNIKVFYSVGLNKFLNAHELSVMLLNEYSHSSGVCVSLQGRLDDCSDVIIVNDIKPGGSAISKSISCRIRASLDRETEVPFAIEMMMGDCLGSSESLNISVGVFIPLSAHFSAFDVSEDVYDEIMSTRGRNKGCTVYSSSSGVVRVGVLFEDNIGPKYVLKAFASFLRGYVVHRDGNKAITVCSRAGQSDVICTLFKLRDSGVNGEYTIAVDIKYMSADESADISRRISMLLASFNNLLLA